MLGRTYRVWSPNLRDVPIGTIGICVRTFRPTYVGYDSVPPQEITLQDRNGKKWTIPSIELLEQLKG